MLIKIRNFYFQIMKYQNTLFRILFSLFLVVCIAVHIYGLLTHFNEESNLSHVIHTISYALCLFAYLFPVRFRLWLYVAGAAYPVAYHAYCFFGQLYELHKMNAICLLVILLIPLAAMEVSRLNKK